MANMSWRTLANAQQYSQVNAGTAYNTSTTLTDVSPGGNAVGQAFTLPAAFLQPGYQIAVKANGIYSTTATPTLLMGIYYGGVAGTALGATSALTMPSSVTTQFWELEALIRVTSTVGASASLLTVGHLLYATSASVTTPILFGGTAATGGAATVNTSTSNILTVGAQWGTSSASNTLTVYQYVVEILN